MQRKYSKEVLINSPKKQTGFSLSGAKTDPHAYRIKRAIVLDYGKVRQREIQSFAADTRQTVWQSSDEREGI